LPDAETLGLIDVAVDAAGNVWATDSACHVLKFDASGQYLSQLFGNYNCGEGNDQFLWTPTGLAFDTAGRLHVSDTYNHRIQVLQRDGTYVTTIGVTGASGVDNAHFSEPRHITIDANNRLYVADDANHRVQVFDVSAAPAITYLATLGAPGAPGNDQAHFNRPFGVATDIGRNRIYVADRDNLRVQVFDYSTRAYVATISVGMLPSDVAVDVAGNIYAPSDWNGTVVHQYSPDYALTHTYGVEGEAYQTDADHFFHPSDVAVAPNGSLYIGECDGRRLTKRTAAGALQWSIGAPGLWRGDNTGFGCVSGLDLDSAGRVYATDTGNNRVQIFTADGGYVVTLGGTWGQGPYGFNSPNDVAIGPGDTIYVADTGNCRVQVFNSSRQYVATIGETGVCGSTNARFWEPRSVDVDAAGNIYVVDIYNQRVQVFDASRHYVSTIGETGVVGDDFGHLNYPTGVAVGAGGRTFVTNGWGERIHVYDETGAYLTTIGGWGQRDGQMRDARGMALDGAGNLYVAEYENHRVQKFAPGVPGWRQVNINGFGDPQNTAVSALETFGGKLYAASMHQDAGARVWRSDDGRTWTAVSELGFGITGADTNILITDMIPFNGQLYAGVGGAWRGPGGQIWRSSDGTTWSNVEAGGFGDSDNDAMTTFGIFGGSLYAGTLNWEDGLEIWRSSTLNNGEWSRVVTGGQGDRDCLGVTGFVEFKGLFYAGIKNDADGPEMWRTADGENWERVVTGGWDIESTWEPTGLAIFGDYLYAGTGNWDAGGQLWRTANGTDWTRVMRGGFGDPNNYAIYGLRAFRGDLYAVTANEVTGMEVWRSPDGVHWAQVSIDGFGDSNNLWTLWSVGVADFQDKLYIGTWANSANGGEVWMMLNQTHLPLVRR